MATSLESKHTPGPWTIYPHTNGRLGCTVTFDGRDTGFTSTDICEVMPEDEHGEAIRVADSNARLIAAAPDLLQALLDLLPGLIIDRRYATADDDMDALNSRIETVRGALEKAGL